METDIVRVGIIGFGGAGIALYYHFSSITGCKVCAVYDPKAGGRDRASNISSGLLVTNDLSNFFSAVDIVVVSSPDNTHAEYIVNSLKNKKHVLCEKPLTDSMEGYRQILQAEKEAKGCVVAVQHQMRFLPLHIKIKQLIEKNELGKVSYIEGYYVHNLMERGKKYDDWRYKDNATPLIYSGCHFVDLLRWILNDEVEEVMGMANHIAFPEYPESDLNVVLLRFKSGVIGKVITAFGAGRPQDHSVRVYGSERSVENNLLFSKDGHYSIISQPFLKSSTGLALTPRVRFGAFRNNLKSVIFGKMFRGMMSLYNNSRGEYAISAYPIRLYEHAYAVHESVLDFVHAIRHGSRPLCTVRESARTVATCLAGVEAYRTNKTVSVKKYWIPELEKD